MMPATPDRFDITGTAKLYGSRYAWGVNRDLEIERGGAGFDFDFIGVTFSFLGCW